jgi:hypothetical protein
MIIRRIVPILSKFVYPACAARLPATNFIALFSVSLYSSSVLELAPRGKYK